MLWGSQGTGRAGGPKEPGVRRVAPKFSLEPIHSPLFPGQCQGLVAAACPPEPGTWQHLRLDPAHD